MNSYLKLIDLTSELCHIYQCLIWARTGARKREYSNLYKKIEEIKLKITSIEKEIEMDKTFYK